MDTGEMDVGRQAMKDVPPGVLQTNNLPPHLSKIALKRASGKCFIHILYTYYI